MLIKTLHLGVIFFVLLTVTACGLKPVKYTSEIRVPDPVVEVKIDEPIATHINILNPSLVTNKVPSYNNATMKTFYANFELDDEQISRQFKKVIASSFEQANLYQSVTKMGSDLASHSLKTQVNIKEMNIDGSIFDSYYKSDVEVQYILTSKEGKILANGSVSVEGLNNEPPNWSEGRNLFNCIVGAMEDALSKAATKITVNLLENSQFMRLARLDSIRNQSYAYNSSSYQPNGSNTSRTQSFNSDNPFLPNSTNFGDYYALVIGNNKYSQMPILRTARNDAEAIAALLENNYSFKVTHIFDATRYDILVALDNLRSKLTFQDNLLIYYAGHGYFDKKARRGYWLPVNAQPNTTADWISNADITDKLRAIDAGHILVVADSCYSGTLTRGVNVTMRNPDYFEKMAALRSRTVLTSGGMEPVEDNNGGEHSVFAEAFLSALEQNKGTMDGTEIFTKIRRPVMLNSDQTPEYSDIRKAGHEGGDFLFIRKD